MSAPVRSATTDKERFYSLTVEGEASPYASRLGPCLLWVGMLDGPGYGMFRPSDGSIMGAHRYAVYLADGSKVPQGMQVDHLCRMRRCVKRSHLQIVTPKENTLRGNSFAAVNALLTGCQGTAGEERWREIHMNSISVRRTLSRLNEHWPLSLDIGENRIKIGHDTQRDRDQVVLTREEWMWVVSTVGLVLPAIDQSMKALEATRDEVPADPHS